MTIALFNTKKIKPLIALLIGCLLASCTTSKQEERTTENDNRLWYKQAAKDWFEALPIGNGKIGAMVFGDVAKEKLQLNEESLWGGCPEDPIPENAKEHYAKFQELNLNGQFEEALNYGLKHLAVSPTSIRSYQTFGDLFIAFKNHSKPQNYQRSLNLHTGIHTTTYTIDGKRFKRESFVSKKYNCLVYHFKSMDNETVSGEISFDRPVDIKQATKNNNLIVDGQIFDDPNGYDDNSGGSGKGGYHLKFAANIAIKNTSGEVTSTANTLKITNSNEFTVLTSLATDYNINTMNFDRTINPLTLTETAVKQATSVAYDSIKKAHIDYHSSMMDRMHFDITTNTQDTIPTDVRLENLKNIAEDKHLTELFFQYGRYLLLSSSGGNSVLPANLQGIWNKELWAAWESDFHLNINLQMNYWPADLCNLSETTEPLTIFLTQLAKKGEVTASAFLDSDGWMAHHVSNPFGRTTASGSYPRSQVDNGYCFPLAGSWMSMFLWRHYQFTQDKTYLKETAYPILSGSAKFILDFLKENEHGELVTAPSYSPENTYIDTKTGKRIRNTVAASIDIQIIRDVFTSCLKMEKVLGIKTALSREISEAIKKLPPIKIGKNGTIQEWYEDYEETEIGHRHVSHMYALYPSSQITPQTPALFEAAKKTIDRRISNDQGQTGWSRGWMINFYARLQEGDKAKEQITELIRKHTSLNLLDLHPPTIFQIDGNLGGTAGIAEMLIQSHGDEIVLLPALPSTWKDGDISGVCTRGGFEITMSWRKGKLAKASLYSKTGNTANIRYGDKKINLATEKGESYALEL